MRIISPLLHRSPKEWPCELLERLLVDEESVPKSAQSFMQGPLLEYHANWRVPSRLCLWQAHVTHSLNGVYSVIKPMVDKPSSEWTEGEVEAAVQLLGLGGGPSLDGRGVSQEADDAWWRFVDKWSKFLVEHPAIQRRVDPFWVIIDLLGVSAPPALAGALAGFPPASGLAVGPGPGLNGSAYFLPFAAGADARHFIGWLQASVPGLRARLTKNVSAPVFY
jgi:hypothetical protein